MSDRKRLRLSQNSAQASHNAAASIPAKGGAGTAGAEAAATPLQDGEHKGDSEEEAFVPPEGGVMGEVKRHPCGVQPTGNLFLLTAEQVGLAQRQRMEG